MFSIHKAAWLFRTQVIIKEGSFSRLTSVMSAWTGLVAISKKFKEEQQLIQKALLFRGASLIARCFIAWYDHVKVIVKIKFSATRRIKLFTRACFKEWADLALETRSMIRIVRSKIWRSRIRFIFVAWHFQAKKHFILEPDLFRARYSLKSFLNAWRVIRRVRILKTVIMPQWKLSRMRISYRIWFRLYARRRRIVMGSGLLSLFLLRKKLRSALMRWPGRLEWEASEEMRVIIVSKGRGRMRLVDVEPPVPGKVSIDTISVSSSSVASYYKSRQHDKDSKLVRQIEHVGYKSFIERVRPSIEQ